MSAAPDLQQLRVGALLDLLGLDLVTVVRRLGFVLRDAPYGAPWYVTSCPVRGCRGCVEVFPAAQEWACDGCGRDSGLRELVAIALGIRS